MQSHSFSVSNLVLAVPYTEILKWITDFYTSKYFNINETQTHIFKTEFVTKFSYVNMSNLYLYILKKYLFIPLHGVMCSGPIGPSFALHSLDITMTMIRLLIKKPRGGIGTALQRQNT